MNAAEPVASPPPAVPPTGARRALTYVLLLVISVFAAAWGAFLVPVRIAGRPVPIGVALALLLVPLCLQGARLAASRAGAAGPWLAWVVTAVVLGSRRREGDLIITSGARGLAFLGVGFLGGAVAVGLSQRPARQRDRGGPG